MAYCVFGIGVVGYIGLVILHILRKLGWTRSTRRRYANEDWALRYQQGGRAEAGTSSFRGGERWIDIEARAKFYSPTPAGCGR